MNETNETNHYSTPVPKIYTVSRLTEEIKSVLEERFEFIWVEGEISNFRAPLSGHYYMALKDEFAQIRAVMFRPQARYLKFTPEDGMKVIAQGRVGVYAPRGEYQIVLDYLEPLGVGALALAFEQLKKKLASEGLFAPELKRPLPFLPQRVAVITSPTGAAIRDFLKVITRRFANLEIIVVPVRVQGDEATEDIIKSLEVVNRRLDVDVIVITRGGGSLEDLWAFNKEELAYAIRRSSIPVVSAVGHEIDTTICDLVADLRAPTPSAAAEMLVAEKEALENRLKELCQRMANQVNLGLRNNKEQLRGLESRLQDPRKRLADSWMKLDDNHARLVRGLRWAIEARRKQLNLLLLALLHQCPEKRVEAFGALLGQMVHSMILAIGIRLRGKKAELRAIENRVSDLSPLSILRRGYSITMKPLERRIIRSYTEATGGDKLHIILGEGSVDCIVEQTGPEQFHDNK